MQHTFLGATGLRVSELCLGAMTFGPESGWGADEATSRAVFEAYAERGGNFVDTANAYTGGTSERFLGGFLQGRRDRFVVATKYAVATDPADLNSGGNGRKALLRSLEGSLRRLRTDYVDLYWVHMWDGFTPIEETLRAMEDVVRHGKALHVGFSDYPAWLVSRADALAEVARSTRPAAIQIEYNLAQRDAERELLPMAETLGLGVLVWSPLAGGALTGKYLDAPDAAGRVASGAVAHFDQYRSERTREVARAIVDSARELGCTPAQLAVAWVRGRSPLHIPIVGARTPAQLEDNLRAAELSVPPEIASRLEAVGAVALGFPHDFLRKGWPRWFGTAHERFDPRARPLGRELLGMPAAADGP